MRYALALSRAHEAELVLLHCEPGSNNAEPRELPESVVWEHFDPEDLAGVRWRSIVAPTDDIGEKITRQAQLEGVDLIVMRSRRRPHRAALLGSTAETVCRNAPCPVLVMHDDEREWIANGSRMNLK